MISFEVYNGQKLHREGGLDSMARPPHGRASDTI
jgi:hypothetical protein